MPFRNPVDIANRALQRLGSTRISDTLGFTEDSKQAAATYFAYDKLRRAELRANLWKFSTRKAVLRPVDTTTMIIAPAMWASTTSYRPGAIVSDAGNTLWISNFPDNLNNAPGNSFFWDLYVGPLSAQPWDSTIAYFAGELVYTFPGDGTYKVYLSLENNNSDNPATGTAWDATVTYMRDEVVTYLSTSYLSLIDLNLNQTPTATPAAWASGTTYASGDQVYGSDAYIYTSLNNGNIGHDPTTSPSNWTNTGVYKAWTDTFTGGSGSKKWLEISPIALTDLFISYPIGAGPSSQSATRNVFRLPAGFLRVAPQDPKAGSMSYLGAPSGLQYDDWLYEGDFIVSRQVDPITYRFIADIQDVTAMDDLFCEGLACRVALETCEELTQSNAKMQVIAGLYKEFISSAKTANSIEIGAVEPPEDDLISCRA